MNEPNSSKVMDTSLRMAVPMWLMELGNRDIDFLQKRAHICSQTVAEKGDVLMYGSKKKGAAGEVFNRLAEGMACLLLITKHPVPFNNMVFHYDGKIEIFETEKEANDRVWPEKKMSNMHENDNGTPESEAVQKVRSETCENATNDHDQNSDTGSENADR